MPRLFFILESPEVDTAEQAQSKRMDVNMSGLKKLTEGSRGLAKILLLSSGFLLLPLQSGADDNKAANLAGFAVAHSAWSIESGETLVTLALLENGDKRVLWRAPGDIRESVLGLSKDAKKQHFERFVVVWDAMVTDAKTGVKTDALSAEWTEKPYTRRIRVHFKYRPGKSKGGFALLGRPEFSVIDAKQPTVAHQLHSPGLEKAFIAGLNSHDKFKGLKWLK